MPARLLLLYVLFRSSWLTVEGDRHVGAATALHRRGGRAAVAVSVGVAGGVPNRQRSEPPRGRVRWLLRVLLMAEAVISPRGWFSGLAATSAQHRVCGFADREEAKPFGLLESSRI
jgi:hypothetical protein